MIDSDGNLIKDAIAVSLSFPFGQESSEDEAIAILGGGDNTNSQETNRSVNAKGCVVIGKTYFGIYFAFYITQHYSENDIVYEYGEEKDGIIYHINQMEL
ncbi:21157_t:CDS:2 [Entrophospora sp. SA101]|nr:7135_t:CDS:2 [Entrophospora sp. SA101]CAJ0766985.1 21157_t:CDS:2 [Entrophospora sp. SA101]CAJ0847899.1 12387_t:CDS:2 [Entrophospora sp. SA101]CAJ0863045.1 5663_t:CDS:2 [Entrophospora sp. SA101]CAJ0910055.1 12063_t:CDS:2 [Entrophospora sp. SA101]